jgi:hypothetical protein
MYCRWRSNYQEGRVGIPGCTRLGSANDKVYQLLAHGRWFFPGIPTSSTTKAGRHDIAEILLKVALNTKNQIIKSPLSHPGPAKNTAKTKPILYLVHITVYSTSEVISMHTSVMLNVYILFNLFLTQKYELQFSLM